jgi:dihydrodiol dehydrogenase / D-xylose 1-dehydrogenase (NADP)
LNTGVWTRFFPIAASLKTLLHEDRIIGAINRVFTDFALYMPLSKLPPDSRTADPTLGAGVLLDIGIYTLTWAALVLESHPAHIAAGSPAPNMISSMTIKNGVDETTSVILNYPHLQAQAVCTSTMCYQGEEEFCRIEGEHGSISIGGVAASSPSFLVIRLREKEERRIDFPKEKGAKGFYWEADAVAADLRDGRLESALMPLQETVRMMGLLDAVRESNGLKYVQDG